MIVRGIRWPTPSRHQPTHTEAGLIQCRLNADGVIMSAGEADRTRMPNAYANIGGWRMSQR